MQPIWLRERYRPNVATFYQEQDEDGITIFGVQDYGAAIQLVSHGLLNAMSVAGKDLFNRLWKPLGYLEPETRMEWYIRREWRYVPLQALWHVSLFFERMESKLAWLLWRIGFMHTAEGVRWRWADLSWRRAKH